MLDNFWSLLSLHIFFISSATSIADSFFKDKVPVQIGRGIRLPNNERTSQESQSSSWSTDTVASSADILLFDMRDKYSIPVRGTKSQMILRNFSQPEEEIKVKICGSLGLHEKIVSVMSSFEHSDTQNEQFDFRGSKNSHYPSLPCSTYYVFINPYCGQARLWHLLLEYKHTESLFCITVSDTTSLRDISRYLNSTAPRSDLHYFDKNNNAVVSDIPVGECQLRSFDKLIVLHKKPKTLQIGHHFRPGIFQIYTLKYCNTDTVLHLKKKFFEKFSSDIPSLKLEKDLYFSFDSEIMGDSQCLSLKVDKELLDESFESLHNEPPVLVHIVTMTPVVGLVVNHKTSRKYSATIQKFVVIGQNNSTNDLRKVISNILNCDDLAVKILVNGKKVQETECLSSIKDLIDGSQLTVEVVCKQVFQIKLVRQSSFEKKIMQSEIECFKLNSVQNLRKMISENNTIDPSIIRMEFKGETMEDHMTLRQYNIKANQTIDVYVLDHQMQIGVVAPVCPKRGTLFIDDGSKTKIEDVVTYFSVKLKTTRDSLRVIHQGCCIAEHLTLKEAGMGFESTMIVSKLDMPSKLGSEIRIIYECTESGNTLKKYGALIKGVLFYGK